MIIVRLQGRLGNQMFQAAVARKLQLEGREVFLDSSMLKYDNNKNELGIFFVQIPEAEEAMVQKLGDCNKSILSKVKRKTFGYKKTHILEGMPRYRSDIFTMDHCYLEGYWQTEKYFKDAQAEIRKMFVFPGLKDKVNREWAKKIRNCQAVSLHIRRGDYLTKNNIKIYGNICTEEYYENAVSYIQSKVPEAEFFVFTDDKEWAGNKYGKQKKFHIVDANTGDKSYIDMQLMSMCKHHILANSSFSWWGAWLDSSENKIVVAPPKWFGTMDTPDIWCAEWVKLEN